MYVITKKNGETQAVNLAAVSRIEATRRDATSHGVVVHYRDGSTKLIHSTPDHAEAKTCLDALLQGLDATDLR